MFKLLSLPVRTCTGTGTASLNEVQGTGAPVPVPVYMCTHVQMYVMYIYTVVYLVTFCFLIPSSLGNVLTLALTNHVPTCSTPVNINNKKVMKEH